MEIHGVSKTSVSRILDRVGDHFVSVAPEHVKMPNDRYELGIMSNAKQELIWVLVIRYTVEPLRKGQESLTKVANFGSFPCTILYKSCLFYPSWQATSFERPPSWLVFIERFHCIIKIAGLPPARLSSMPSGLLAPERFVQVMCRHVRQQAVTRSNVDPYRSRQVGSVGCNEWMIIMFFWDLTMYITCKCILSFMFTDVKWKI